MKNLNIFICEDNKIQRENLEDIINKILINKDMKGKVHLSTDSPYEILEYIEKNKLNGIYFLDIDIGQNINGIELAMKINKVDNNAIIVMITSYPNMSKYTFKYHIGAIDYIVKNNNIDIYTRISECLELAYNKLNKSYKKEYLIIQTNQFIDKVKYENILFIETSKKNSLILYTDSSFIEFRGTLKEIKDRLDKRFIKCHKSFIVNKDKILKINKKDRILFMENGYKCLVSRFLLDLVINQVKNIKY